MTKRSKESKKRKELDSITVGSGITEYSRPPSILDPLYRDKALKGAPVDSRVQRTPAETLQIFQREVEQFCRDVFEDEKLPDPFSFIHPEGRFLPFEGWEVMSEDLDYIKKITVDLDYRLSAWLHTPHEDHSQLWYAARLAAEFTTLDLILAQSKANEKPAEALILYAAQTGAEIGRLDKERRLKFGHEPDALRGKATKKAASEGGKARSQIDDHTRRRAFKKIDEHVAKEHSLANAARIVCREFRLTIKPGSLVKSYRRTRGAKK